MGSLRDLTLKIGANVNGLKAGLADAQSQLKGFNKSVGSIGPMLAGAFSVGAVVAFGKAAFTAFEEQERANKRLQAAVGGSKYAYEKLTEQATELQQRAGVDDTAIMQIQMLGAAAGYSVDKIKKITEASMALASATDGDLQSAYMTISKSFTGQAKNLKALGPEFANLTKEQLINGDAVDLLITNYGKLIDESATSTAKLTQAWDEVKESAGYAISDIMIPALEGLAEVMNEIGRKQSFWQKIGTLMGYASGIPGLGASLSAGFDAKNTALKPPTANDYKGKKKTGGGGTGGGGSKKKAEDDSNFYYENFDKNIEVYTRWKEIYTDGEEFTKRIHRDLLDDRAKAANDWLDAQLDSAVKQKDAENKIVREKYENEIEALNKAKADANAILTEMNNMVTEAMANLIVTFVDSFVQVFTGDMGLEDMFNNILKSISTFLKQFGTYLIAYGLAVKAFKKAIADPVAAIITGAALVAGSAIINSFLKNGTNRIGMATGGIVPAGFPNDTYPAMLSSGEKVIPKAIPLDSMNNSVRVYGVLRAGDIYLSSKRGEYLRGRKG